MYDGVPPRAGAVMTTDPFSAFEFDADDAGRVLDEALVGADDGELFLETSTAESLAFDDGRLKVANFDAERGFGLRGVFGEASGFAHSSDPPWLRSSAPGKPQTPPVRAAMRSWRPLRPAPTRPFIKMWT
jgi:hypothetical protein